MALHATIFRRTHLNNQTTPSFSLYSFFRLHNDYCVKFLMHSKDSHRKNKRNSQPHRATLQPDHTHTPVLTGNAGDLVESTKDGHFDNIPAPFVSDVLKVLAPTYFDNQDLADCELRLPDGHFLWANEFYLNFSSKYFAEVFSTKHGQPLHPHLQLVEQNDTVISVVDLPINSAHRALLKDLLLAVSLRNS